MAAFSPRVPGPRVPGLRGPADELSRAMDTAFLILAGAVCAVCLGVGFAVGLVVGLLVTG